jgi:ABC-type nitrate/sulfonate/bicarbonate transport system ATPase subunit
MPATLAAVHVTRSFAIGRGPPVVAVQDFWLAEPRCGVVFQSCVLFPWKTAQGNVEFGLRMEWVATD